MVNKCSPCLTLSGQSNKTQGQRWDLGPPGQAAGESLLSTALSSRRDACGWKCEEGGLAWVLQAKH